MGGLGLLGTAPSKDAMKDCDTFFIIGSNFPYMQFLPQPGQAKCVQIDIDAARIGLRYPVDVPLVGDTRRVLEALLGMVQPKSDKSFLEKMRKDRAEWNKLMQERATRMDKPMKPQVVAAQLNKFLTDDAIIISDCGTVTTWASRYIKMRDRQMFTCTGMLATMANGLPYSVGSGHRASGPAGSLFHRRRRFHHADVRDGHHRQVQAAGQGRHHQEQHARPDQMGADGHGGQSAIRRRSASHRLRQIRRGGRLSRLHHRRPQGV